MADQFFPVNFDVAPVLTLDVTLYTMRATIFNPDSSIDQQLPDHVWLLVDDASSLAVARSTPSDSTGTCRLGLPLPIVKGNFSFLFFPFPNPINTPLPDAALIRAGYLSEREAWIDLGKPGEWAVPPAAGALEIRRLLRVPAWSTKRKASLGGFKVAPPKTTQFASKGIIPFAELAVFGPWDIPLDFNWIRAKVNYSFFDWQQNKAEPLPPGLLIEARRDLKAAGGTARVGAGISSSLKDGTCYMLLEGPQSLWKECHIQFHTPGSCFIDLSSKATPTPDNRLANGTPPTALEDFNQLPLDWHSLGMRASFTSSARATGAAPPAPAASSPPSKDKLWDGLRFDLAKAANGDNVTLNFHLDDVVVCDASGQPIKKNATGPLTLLDHFLSVMNPDPQTPYQTTVTRLGLVIPAPAAYPIPAPTGSGAPPPRTQSARLVHFDGGLHDLVNDRVPVAASGLGKAPCIGARAAVIGKHPSVTLANPLNNPAPANLGLEMHLVDVPGVADPATNIPLQHLLLYLPVRIDIDKARPLNPSSSAADARKLLNDAAELWSPGHPGSKAATKAKRYALIPNAASKRSQKIIRIRTFFAEKKKKPKLIIALTNDNSKNRDGRSNSTDGSATSPTRIVFFDSAVQREKTPGVALGDAGDKVTSPSLTLAHELGHGVHGLLDEYVEQLDTLKAVDPVAKNPAFANVDPLLPSFDQLDEGFSDWRPYYSDLASLMHDNHVPRLRHFWHHANNLNAQFTVPEAPFDLVHETFTSSPGLSDPGTSLTYTVPPRNVRSPWLPIFKDVAITNGFGKIALFALGDDEGSVGALFRSPTPPGAGLAAEGRMQGLLIVRSRICFVFDRTMSPLEKFNVLQRDFQSKIYNTNYVAKIRFLLLPLAPAPSGIQRIAVLFQPHYSVGSAEIGTADVVFDLAKTATPPRANPFLAAARGKQVRVMASDFTFELAWRHVLGVATALPGGTAPDLGVLRATDLDGVARLVERQLGETSGFRSVSVFP